MVGEKYVKVYFLCLFDISQIGLLWHISDTIALLVQPVFSLKSLQEPLFSVPPLSTLLSAPLQSSGMISIPCKVKCFLRCRMSVLMPRKSRQTRMVGDLLKTDKKKKTL